MTYAALRSMYVKAGHRRQGHGGSLVREFLTWAREQGCAEALVDHYLANTAAAAFYERHGFAARSVSRVYPL